MRYLKQIRPSLAMVLMLFLSSGLTAREPENPGTHNAYSYNDYSVFSDDKFSLIEYNYLQGIKSDNVGLQTSCAYFLGEMKSSKAMIPLLMLATSGSTEEARVIAGLSLYKIQSNIGMCRLKGLSKSDKSELVRRVFDRIYKKYVSDNYTFEEI